MGKNKFKIQKMTFQLDLAGGGHVLQNMAMRTVTNSANSIKGRASSMASQMSSKPPTFSVYSSVGKIKRGNRAIAVVRSDPIDNRQTYIAIEAIKKSMDAGRFT